ncbi:uncharacterized protein DUF695 [Sinobacterium caligoides]|uniref:Uncharacterized protein DUF695 n=1 Tax=Sinobacterium caligoides TaxID=933926 RepID=A0A3N2DNQ8_9GAMM|nr:DUF695 domain-containing protein [Sinobacterium caligoides]ROS01396.1 uncharacterized protein DUF695 [Sinobacterium caligoides]
MSNTKFVVPESSYTVVQREDEGAKVYAAVNTSLASIDKAERQLFGWQLSIILDLQTEDAQGMTLDSESKEIEPFCQQLETDLRAGGNAMPLARITWRKTRELLFRVYNPAMADKLIQQLIEAEENPRPFSYTIDPDMEWEMAEDYLKQFSADNAP